MHAQLVRLAVGAVALALVSGCSGGGDDGSQDRRDDGTRSPREAKPSDTTGPIKDAALAAGSVVVTRTTRPTAADERVTHEEIEVELTEPPSGRVLHVGEEIWTLDVVGGTGYLKDQTERKSTNRWRRLTSEQTAERLEDVTLDGLLGVLDDATAVTRTEKAAVAGQAATCHTVALGPAPTGAGTGSSTPSATATPGDEDTDGAAPESARVCVDGDRRPVELVVTSDDAVTTSTFTSWGVAVEALAPPPGLVDDGS